MRPYFDMIQASRQTHPLHILLALFLWFGSGCASNIPHPAVEGFSPANLTYQEAKDLWGKTLKKVVKPYGMIDFQEAAAESSGLSAYLSFVAEVGPYNHPDKFASRGAKLAHFINSYNALAMYAIIASNFPTDLYSAWDRSRFDRAQYKVAGKWITLSDYEEEILRAANDPRLHFVLSHMTLDSPRLLNQPFQENQVEKQLDGATREFINNSYYVTLNPDRKTVRLTGLFEVYEEDFSRQEDSLIAFINRYRNQKIPESFKVKFRPYNWYIKRKEMLPPQIQRTSESLEK